VATNISNRLSTDTVFFASLIEDIKQGRIKIPKFQRPYVWEDEQALKLLDSIANSYPIGSLLIWRTGQKLNTERDFGDFIIPTTDDLTPTDYVLDGQQRLTVIYSCFGAYPSDPGFAAAFDLDKEIFHSQKNVQPGLAIFPLRKLYDTTELLDFRTALQAHPNKDVLQPRLDQLIKAITTYKLPNVVLKDLSVEEVCPIFERINSAGTKLSTYDLMVAATWSHAFDLDTNVEEIAAALQPKGFGDIDKTTVLKCMSAVQLGSIKESSLRGLRDLDDTALAALTDRTKSALLRTVDLLSTEFKIHSWDFISYQAIVIIVCYLYSQIKDLDAAQTLRLRKWYWRASFSERYKVGGEAFVSNDLPRVVSYIILGSGKDVDFGDSPTSNDWSSVAFRSNASRSRAFILALALRSPKNLTNGVTIDTSEALSFFNKKQYHHVYPRAFLKRHGVPMDDNLLANICMLSAQANNKISDDAPAKYLPAIALALGTGADSVFLSNLLPAPSSFDYANSTYEEFIASRVTLIDDYARNLCNGA
jgi:hypothetical protein